MGQAIAKKEVQEGIKFYHNQLYEAAIMKWRRALHRVRDKQYRFLTLEYLVTAHAELSQYRDMLAYAVMQIDIANDIDDSIMRVQAYLNLARSSEMLCEYHKAISYSRHCIQNKPHEIRTYGAIYLIQGKAYFGLSNFTKSLEMLEYAIRISKKCNDPELELLIYTALGHVFLELKDYDKGLKFQLKAVESVKSLSEAASNFKFQRLTSLNLGIAYLNLNRMEPAKEHLETALQSALEAEDRAVQARCLCSTAHIYRHNHDAQRASEYYESAATMLLAAGDKLGQLGVLKGMAKNMEARKDSTGCEGKALEYYKKALDIATNIGNKLQMLKCNKQIARLYGCLGDQILEELHSKRCAQLERDLELHCWVCGREIGAVPDRLELFSCFHIAHQRCVRSVQKPSVDVTYHLGTCDKCSGDQSTGALGEIGDGEPQAASASPGGASHCSHRGDIGQDSQPAGKPQGNCIRNIPLGSTP